MDMLAIRATACAVSGAASARRAAARPSHAGALAGQGAIATSAFTTFQGLRAGSPPRVGTAAARRPVSVTASASSAAVATAGAGDYDYDLVCIGAGSGGVRGSRTVAGYGLGLKVAVVEMPFATKASDTTGGMGGTCVIRGCVPKKLLVYGSHFAEDFEDAEGFGWSLPGKPAHDWAKLIANKNKELLRLTGIYGNLLKNSGVDVLEGRGKLVDNHTVEVAGKTYTAKHILVAVGGRAFVPDVPGAELGITSDDALELPALPKKIVVIGGGYIALEFAAIFKSMGSEVHLVFRQDLPLRGFDEEVRAFVHEQYEAKGITVHAGASPESITKLEGGGLRLETTKGPIDADEVMWATGRKPNVANLGLEAAGVELTKSGAIKVDEYSRTTAEGVWAIGDVTDRINLTPVALMEGMAFAKTAFLDQPTKPDHDNVACAVFSQPPVATVGMTEEEALADPALGDLDIYTSSFRPMKATLSGRAEKAFMKLIVDQKSDKVVGVHMVGSDGPEIMQGIGIAIKMGATKADFDATIGIHPTAAEEFVTMRTKTRTASKA